ncbi:S-adenosyl-L-methionine-dependent methyltransferase [Melampsora americana]|nr:S-adenosyl-L-methionine-dependent methyltransferase [Melampsora americana]
MKSLKVINHHHHHHHQSNQEVYRLHAVCLPQSVHSLKLILKHAKLYERHQPIKSNDPLIQIPLNLIDTSSKSLTPVLLPIDHPLVPPLPPTEVPLDQSSLLGYQWLPDPIDPPTRLKHLSASPLIRALQRFHQNRISNEILTDLPTWEVYHDFLLFQPDAFLSKAYQDLIKNDSDQVDLLKLISEEFQCNHIARKGYINRTDPKRHPHIEPLYGDFGQDEFDLTFWTNTRFSTDHGQLTYVWAPTQTMYCRGNAIEKRRIANLPNVMGRIVVDLFCGIGFFAFPYLLAGAQRVIGCEISSWAIEGLKRGAIANNFLTYVFESTEEIQLNHESENAKLWIVPYENEKAIEIYRGKATHVNLGLLPSSIEFLPQALLALKPEGGWLHIHGEARRKEESSWVIKVLDLIRSNGENRKIHLEGLHRVKSMGPVLIHWVAEVCIGSPNQN